MDGDRNVKVVSMCLSPQDGMYDMQQDLLDLDLDLDLRSRSEFDFSRSPGISIEPA